MKNRLLPKILLPVVLVIWGLVAWRFISGGDAPLPTQPILAEEKAEPSAVFSQSTLYLDYGDPFLDHPGRRPVQTSVSGGTGIQRQIQQVVPTRRWSVPDLVYRGGVKNESSVTGILRYDGKEMMVRAGDSIPGIRVLDLGLESISLRMRDSVVVIRSR